MKMKNRTLLFLSILGLLTLSCDNDKSEDYESLDNVSLRGKVNKVEVCHYDSETGEYKVLTISEKALQAHLRHGDRIGDCNPVYLDENGVTIKAKDWAIVGDTGEINGITYTVVDEAMLRNMVTNSEDVTANQKFRQTCNISRHSGYHRFGFLIGMFW